MISVPAHLIATIGGARARLEPRPPQDVAQAVSIDNAVVAPHQTSRENVMTFASHAGMGPFDYHLTRRLVSIRKKYDLPYPARLVRPLPLRPTAALEAGPRPARHYWASASPPRTGTSALLEALRRLAELITLHVQTDLMPSDWHRTPGDLRDWPSTLVQPGDELVPVESRHPQRPGSPLGLANQYKRRPHDVSQREEAWNNLLKVTQRPVHGAVFPLA